MTAVTIELTMMNASHGMGIARLSQTINIIGDVTLLGATQLLVKIAEAVQSGGPYDVKEKK
jgi:hypothetical protein